MSAEVAMDADDYWELTVEQVPTPERWKILPRLFSSSCKLLWVLSQYLGGL
jgi:hypothetical protein